jgi:2'-5' RNA ligase
MRFTLRNERRDFPEWHLGRSHYALWALDLDSAAVRQRVHAAQRHLADYLLEGYCRQPHVTVGLCGFLSAAPEHADDFGPAALQVQLTALRQLPPAPFGLRVGGLDSFSSVPYLGVQADAGALELLRQCLASAGMNATAGHYTPHVTVGLYAGVWPLSELQTQFDRFTDHGELRVPVRGISLVSYAASEIGGPLTTLADYDFARDNLRWTESLPSELQAFARVT